MSGDFSNEIPDHCPGTESELAGKVSSCQGCPNQQICASGQANDNSKAELIKAKLSTVRNKLLIMSGKGGVGKSTLTSMVGRYLAHFNKAQNIAILDIDICGPSMPRVMGVLDEKIHQSGTGWSPVFVEDNLSVMSIGFLLGSPDDAVIWRGPKKNGMIQQFFTEVDWSENIDYMLIDTPPGTSDEHLSVSQMLKSINNVAAMVITTPQEISLLDVRKEIDFIRKVNIPILGIVENMTPFMCPKCETQSEIFPENSGGVKKMSTELGIPYLGNLPLDPLITRCCDEGLNPFEEFNQTPFVSCMRSIVSTTLNKNLFEKC